MNYHFTLPATFRPADYLPFRMRSQHDTARWFVSTILTKLAHQRGPEVVRLHGQFLKRMMGGNYARIIEALLDGRAVYRRPYSVGESFAYGLDERFASVSHVVVPVTDDVMIQRIRRQRERVVSRSNQLFLPVHHQLFKHQTRLCIDATEARRCLATLSERCNRFDAQGIQIGEIESKKWRMTVSRYGRVQNNITSLKKELRTHLRLGNDRLWELDLVAAQPSLLALLIQKQTTHFDKTRNHRRVHSWPACPVAPFPCSPAAAVAFRASVLDGDLYGCLADAAGVVRCEAKRRFLVDVLAKRGTYPSIVEDAFRVMFPAVLDYVRAVNRNDHATLIRTLQKLESWLVIEQVCGRLDDTPAITLHDGVFASQSNMPQVERAFQAVTNELDFPMRWRVSPA
jgi:hypothetical protein